MGGSRVLSTMDALTNHLKPKCYGPGVFQYALHLCHIGTKAGPVVSTTQGCPGVYPPVATLIRCLTLIWAWGLGLIKAAVQLGYPDCVHWSLLSRWGRVGSTDHVGQLLLPRELSRSLSSAVGLFYMLVVLLNQDLLKKKKKEVKKSGFFSVPQSDQGWCRFIDPHRAHWGSRFFMASGSCSGLLSWRGNVNPVLLQSFWPREYSWSSSNIWQSYSAGFFIS